MGSNQAAPNRKWLEGLAGGNWGGEAFIQQTRKRSKETIRLAKAQRVPRWPFVIGRPQTSRLRCKCASASRARLSLHRLRASCSPATHQTAGPGRKHSCPEDPPSRRFAELETRGTCAEPCETLLCSHASTCGQTAGRTRREPVPGRAGAQGRLRRPDESPPRGPGGSGPGRRTEQTPRWEHRDLTGLFHVMRKGQKNHPQLSSGRATGVNPGC